MVKGHILGASGFKIGSLSVRYLGVPLITTKLRSVDCQPLVDRIGELNVGQIELLVMLGEPN